MTVNSVVLQSNRRYVSSYIFTPILKYQYVFYMHIQNLLDCWTCEVLIVINSLEFSNLFF